MRRMHGRELLAAGRLAYTYVIDLLLSNLEPIMAGQAVGVLSNGQVFSGEILCALASPDETHHHAFSFLTSD